MNLEEDQKNPYLIYRRKKNIDNYNEYMYDDDDSGDDDDDYNNDVDY